MKFKQITAAILAAVISTAMIPLRVFALDEKDTVKAPAAVLMEASTGKVLFQISESTA
ncbi:MAG: hypothetical protein PHE09_04835 [Oscillospiraceae bacterium]|nr:hypothetical protein [Oscillospiraceae bacterium]